MGGRFLFRAALVIAIGCASLAKADGPDSLVAAEAPAAALPIDLKVPAGFTIELVAGPPLVERPIVASFDDEGQLYVAESSGSNDPVEKQLAERPHRIVRLEDVDGDGKYDRRVVFADRMMFPEGCQFFDGSLYVAAPPSIWKLTDTDGDGVADERSEWFQGKTLTGCANDLHGPYLGPDGWFYWCKGAFAEQTHLVNGREWKSRAAHIFRCQPDGSGLEPVMTGGMDNPVDVVFTPEGERIFSATFLQTDGRRDGLAHAIYGGVYGKNHGVLDGHARTGELMPAIVLTSSSAPCGLERYESAEFGDEYRGNLFACQFNVRQVTRHVLRTEGSTFASEDSNFVWTDNVDFHPTDVLMDADGSLLVIDTGGWYKLCCPTSQLWKPDVLGGIYRVRREGAHKVDDPRGRAIDWAELDAVELWALHADGRPAVRQRACRELLRRQDTAEFAEVLAGLGMFGWHLAVSSVPQTAEFPLADEKAAAVARTWTLGQFDSDMGRAGVRELLGHPEEAVRHAALNLVSLHRDEAAYPQVAALLADGSPAIRRVAAEALGRMGRRDAVPRLLEAASRADDRVLRHSITYALIELDDAAATRTGLASDTPGTRAVALVALDQMPGGGVRSQEVIPFLNASDATLRDAAQWLVTRHPEWGAELSAWFREQLAALNAVENDADNEPSGATAQSGNVSTGSGRPTQSRGHGSRGYMVRSMLVEFAGQRAIQELLAETLTDEDAPVGAKTVALQVMAEANVAKPPAEWRVALAQVLRQPQYREGALAAARKLPAASSADDALNAAMVEVADSQDEPAANRVRALAVVAGGLAQLTDSQFVLLNGAMSPASAVDVRSAAVDALSGAPLSREQLGALCRTIETAGPLELNRLLAAYSRVQDDKLGEKLLAALDRSPALASLRVDVLRTSLAKYGPKVQAGIDALESRVNIDAATQRKRIDKLLPLVATGDVRRGHAVFHSAKAACSACHVMGYAGGTVGPELSRIGEIRTERDLLESILYPSLSFVQSYEPVQVITTDGRILNGRVRDETEAGYVIATGPNEEARVPRDEVEAIEPSTVSVMPGGLDGQLTEQELLDLVAFLKQAK